MKADDIENKKGTNQYCVQIFPEAHLQIRVTSEDQLFFHPSKGEYKYVDYHYILVCKDAILIFKFFSELLVQKVKNFIGSHVYSLFL